MPLDNGSGGALDVDVAGVDAAATALLPLADSISHHGAATKNVWQEAAPYYLAPEAGQLLAALDPVERLAGLMGERVGALGRALAAYAEQAGPLIKEIRRLQAAVTDGAPEAAAAQEDAIKAKLARLLAIENACAAAILALTQAEVRPENYKVGETVERTGLTLSLGLFTFGPNAALKVTQLSDGVQLTAVDAAKLEGGIAAGRLVDFGAGVTFESGSTWKFRDLPEAERFRASIEAYVGQQRQFQLDPRAAAVAYWLGTQLAPPRAPDLLVTEAAFVPRGRFDVELGTDVHAKGAVEGVVKRTVSRDLVTGAVTTTDSFDQSYQGSFEITGMGRGGAEGKVVEGSGVSVTRDPEGRITKVALTTTEQYDQVGSAGGSGGAGSAPADPDGGRHRRADPALTAGFTDKTTVATSRVTTTEIPIAPEDRALAEDYLAAKGDAAGYDPATYYPERAVTGDGFQNLAHRKGVVTVQDFRDVTRTQEGELGAKIGKDVGVKGTVERVESTAVGGSHLGAAGPDGVRRPAPLPPPG